MEQLLDELDCNSQVYSSQMEKNRVLAKLLEETQKNEARGIQERYSEKQRLESEAKVSLNFAITVPSLKALGG